MLLSKLTEPKLKKFAIKTVACCFSSDPILSSASTNITFRCWDAAIADGVWLLRLDQINLMRSIVLSHEMNMNGKLMLKTMEIGLFGLSNWMRRFYRFQ
jgi:hypothetical protein